MRPPDKPDGQPDKPDMSGSHGGSEGRTSGLRHPPPYGGCPVCPADPCPASIRVQPWFGYGDDLQPWLNVHVHRKPSEQDRKGVYHLGWNGKRMAKGADWRDLQARHPELAIHVIEHVTSVFSRGAP